MVQTTFTYPVILEPDEDGRLVVSFPDLPGAITDGADQAEALREAADCLSEALATRIAHGEAIPPASPPAPGQHVVSPDPTIALKAALHMTMYRRDMTVADLAALLEMGDWHQAARLIDPKCSSKLTSLAAALESLGCRIAISISDDDMLHTIKDLKPLEVGRLQLWFADGPEGVVVDLSPMLASGGVFEPLREQARWNAVEIADGGHALVWHAPSGIEDDDVDLSADALWLMAHPRD